MKVNRSTKKVFFDENLSRSVDKSKKVRNTMNSFVMPKKTVVSSFSEIDDNKSLTYDIKTMPKDFKSFFSNLAEAFLVELLDLSN